MLRVAFLPSDFNPMLLMLGEPEDLRALSFVLRRFAHEGGETWLDELPFCAARRTRVMLAGDPGPVGLHPMPGTDDAFVWRLDADRAVEFAEQIEALAVPPRLSGSELLESTTEEEIVVKVSRGEYTDDFLLPEAG